MQRVPISAITPGMVLAQPIERPNGFILAGAGLVLTQEAIDRIRNTGVPSVFIEGESNTLAELQKVCSSLDHFFRRHQTDAFMTTLKKALFLYFSRRIASCTLPEEDASPDDDGDAATEGGKAT